MYRHFITEAERDRIVAEYDRYGDTPPHCNETMFHEPGICAYCDGYYRTHPDFRPTSYVTPAANGWGGNQAPVVDDEKAAAEQAEWDRMFGKFSGEAA